MAIHRTVDHQEIREWIEKHRAFPAVIAGSGDDEADAELTLSFTDPDKNAVHITWDEFFGTFETQHLRFRYSDPEDHGEGPDWAYSFESREVTIDKEDETQLPEDIEDIAENMFPSAPMTELSSPDMRHDDAGGELL